MRPLSTPGRIVLEEHGTSSAGTDSTDRMGTEKIRAVKHHKLLEQNGLNRENLSLFKFLECMEFDGGL